jgi:hypothetical protein
LHASAFDLSEYCPAAQSTHEPLLTNVPGLQMPQYPSEAPPHPLRSPPPPHDAHTVQLLWPALLMNVSEAQALQLAASPAEKKPAGHSVQSVLPNTE